MTTSLPAPTDAQARAIEASAGAIREAVQALRGLGGYLERVFGTVPEDLVGYFGGDRLTSLFVTDPDWEIGNKGRWSIECCPTIRFGAIGNRLARRVRLRRA